MRLRAHLTSGILASLALIGCNGPEGDDGPPMPKFVEFEGKVDPQLVGFWKSEGGRSGLDLTEDGSAKILTVSASPKGDVRSTLEGNWLCKDKDLLLRYTAPGQPQSTVKYRFELSGDSMTLIQGSGRMKTVYKRK